MIGVSQVSVGIVGRAIQLVGQNSNQIRMYQYQTGQWSMNDLSK